jgi:DNA-binding beta-propeller fold protein YncE
MGLRAPVAVLALFILGAPSGIAQEIPVLVEEFRFGDFRRAHRIESDPFGNIFVSDAVSHSVHKYGPDGRRIALAGGPGWSASQFDQPAGIDAALGVAVYVADRGNNRIVRLDKDLNVMGVFSTRDDPSAESSFGEPLDVVITKLENMFILDGENSRVVTTSGFATVDRVFGGVDGGQGRLRKPLAMARGEDDRLYVLEADRVAAFDTFGNYIFSFAYKLFDDAKGIACSKGRVAVVTSSDLFIFTAEGMPEQRFSRELFVFAGETGPFEDVAMTDTRLYILTAREALVFPAITNQ